MYSIYSGVPVISTNGEVSIKLVLLPYLERRFGSSHTLNILSLPYAVTTGRKACNCLAVLHGVRTKRTGVFSYPAVLNWLSLRSCISYLRSLPLPQ